MTRNPTTPGWNQRNPRYTRSSGRSPHRGRSPAWELVRGRGLAGSPTEYAQVRSPARGELGRSAQTPGLDEPPQLRARGEAPGGSSSRAVLTRSLREHTTAFTCDDGVLQLSAICPDEVRLDYDDATLEVLLQVDDAIELRDGDLVGAGACWLLYCNDQEHPDPRLHLLDGDRRVQTTVCLSGDSFTLGRERGDWVLPDESALAGVHLQLVRRGDDVFLSNLAGPGHTWLRIASGESVSRASTIAVNDRILRVGNLQGEARAQAKRPLALDPRDLEVTAVMDLYARSQFDNEATTIRAVEGFGRAEAPAPQTHDAAPREPVDWVARVQGLLDQAETREDKGAKLEHLQQAAQICEEQLGDHDLAFDALLCAFRLDPADELTTREIERVAVRADRHGDLRREATRLAETIDDPRSGSALWMVIAGWYERLGQLDQAVQSLERALHVDPGHVPAMVRQVGIYKQRADWLKAARRLEQASGHAHDHTDKTNLLAEAAFIHYEQLEDEPAAVELLTRTLQLDPEHARAGLVLAGIYVEREDFGGADPLLDMLGRKVDQLGLEPAEQRELYLRAARVARSLGKATKALKRYKRAYDLDPTHHEVLQGMAELLFERQDWARAFGLYRTILRHHRDLQSSADLMRLYVRLGAIKHRQAEPRKARAYLSQALEVEPRDPEALDTIIELHTQAGDWAGVIEAKRAQLDLSPEDDERFSRWREIGELCVDRLGDEGRGAEAYEQAVALRPHDYPLLHVLLDLYTQAQRWEDAIRTIDRIVAQESDAPRRSRYHYTAGVVLRDWLGVTAPAIDRFNMALDDDPSQLRAFQAIDALLTKSKEWKALERSYRRMLERLPEAGQEPLKLTLWGNLAEIYRTRLGDFESAVVAFKMAATLDPGNVARHIKTAELCERLFIEQPESYAEAAVREHQLLIAHKPFRYSSYHALFDLYERTRRVDQAYCVAATLCFLKQATAKEEALFKEHRRAEFPRARQRLGEDTLRRHVVHPDQDPYLTAVLGLIAPAVAAWRAVELPASLDPDGRIDVSVDQSPLSRTTAYIKRVLDVTLPDVFVRPQDPGDLTLMNIKRDDRLRPALVVFENLCRGQGEAQLAFALGRAMMDLYVPHFCFVALERSPRALQQVLMACRHGMGLPASGDPATLDPIARQLVSRMQPSAQDQLRVLLETLPEAGEDADVGRWAAASELTAYRAGLLLSSDLQTAAHVLSQEKAPPGTVTTMSTRDKLRELVLYSISDDYFMARKALGLQARAA